MALFRLKCTILFLSIIAVYGTNTDASANSMWLSTNENNSIQYYLHTSEHSSDLCYLKTDVSNSRELNISANATCWIFANHNDTIQIHPYTPERQAELCYLGPDVSNSCEFNVSTNLPFLLPTNDINSIQYHLYTPDNPNEFCYFEPYESNNCKFNESFEVKILIHGFTVNLLPGNFFEINFGFKLVLHIDTENFDIGMQIKDTFLEYNNYNVIIVNWTKYDGNSMSEYPMVFLMVYPVALVVGEMINFLVTKGVNASDIHVIGHSLGAHIAGVAGRRVPNLGRVTGLDPAGPFFSTGETFDRLSNTSARLVDVIHTSNFVTGVGLGFPYPIGTIDFYPNGGNEQPTCHMGGKYLNFDAELHKITTTLALACCHHDMVLQYFMNSIRLCSYPSVECESYERYSSGKCNVLSNPTNKMGFFCESIPGLPTESTFYLNTSAEPPYCEI